jgi:lipoate-protein ligase A
VELLRKSLGDPAADLALDESLLLAAEALCGPEVLRLWEPPHPVVVVGAGGSVAHDVNLAVCREAGVPVLRRASGGGTVLLGPGCLCFSLVLRTDRAPGLHLIQPSIRYVLEKNLAALRALVPQATVEGTSDLAVSGRKFSGSAQQRKRQFFLHHGTLLYDMDLQLVSRLLQSPERQPEYRRGRPHGKFLMNLPASRDGLEQLLIAEWQPTGELREIPEVAELVAEKYGRDEWNLRR